jgi:hypothetical protein
MLTNRTFDYRAVNKPVTKIRNPIAKKVKPVPELTPVNTVEFTAKLVHGFRDAPKLRCNKASVRWLDLIGEVLHDIRLMVVRGDYDYTKKLMGQLISLLIKGPGNSTELKLAKMGNQRHANSMLRLAQETFRQASDYKMEFSDLNDDLVLDFETVEATVSTAADYLHMTNYILLGQRDKAREVASGLDTSTREDINHNAWEWLQKE